MTRTTSSNQKTLNPNTCMDPKAAPDDAGNLAPSYQNDFPRRSAQMPVDIVDEQSMESFPASDPPAGTGTSLPH